MVGKTASVVSVTSSEKFLAAVVKWTTHTILHQFLQQRRPFLSEEIGSSQTAISADAHQTRDVVLYKVESCLEPSLTSPEFLATCTADHCSTLQPHTVMILSLLLVRMNILENMY